MNFFKNIMIVGMFVAGTVQAGLVQSDADALLAGYTVLLNDALQTIDQEGDAADNSTLTPAEIARQKKVIEKQKKHAVEQFVEALRTEKKLAKRHNKPAYPATKEAYKVFKHVVRPSFQETGRIPTGFTKINR